MSSKPIQYLKLNPYLEITSGINAVLTFSEGVIKVVGNKGSGKTAVCHLLLDEMKAEDLETLLFTESPDSAEAFEANINETLALKKNDDFVSALSSYLVGKPAHEQKLIIIFDDAETINDDVFRIISRLVDVKHNLTPLISIVLCGNEKLNSKLFEAGKESIQEKIILNLQVQAMSKSELREYCIAYMAKVGLDNHNLTESDYETIYQSCKGFPDKLPAAIYEILDQEVDAKEKGENNSKEDDKGLMGKIVALDDDPEPELAGLSVADREQVLMEFKDQVPWRWQSNGVAVAVVVLFAVVAYGLFSPESVSEKVIVQEIEFLQSIEPVNEELVSEEAVDEIIEIESPLIVEEVVDIALAPVAEDMLEPEDIDLPVEATLEPELVSEVAVTEGTVLPEENIAEEVSTDEVIVEQEEVVVVEEPVIEPVIPEEATGIVLEEAVATVEPIVEPAPAPIVEESSPMTVATDQALIGPQSFINDWAEAWASQDIEQYFQHYQEMFAPAYHDSKSMWRGDRHVKISRPNYIEIDVDGMELVDSGSKGLTVRFWLNYVSSYYKDRTLKEVLLTENSLGEFFIMQERNLEVEILPYYP